MFCVFVIFSLHCTLFCSHCLRLLRLLCTFWDNQYKKKSLNKSEELFGNSFLCFLRRCDVSVTQPRGVLLFGTLTLPPKNESGLPLFWCNPSYISYFISNLASFLLKPGSCSSSAMAVEGGMKCVKYILFGFNFISLVSYNQIPLLLILLLLKS